jgi:nitroreductase/NAD-dependent dihydropyrimidine dehydrogenase PreA subunit
MEFLKVDMSKCTKCGICAAICPGSLIAVDKGGPKETGSGVCIACGHCVASCPVEALDNINAPLADQVPLGDYTPIDIKTAAVFMRSRRSIRCYKDEQVPREKILKILNIARFASTGANSQGLSYIVISDKETIRKLSEATMEWMEQDVAANPERAEYLKNIVSSARKSGKDRILRSAPHLILAVCGKGLISGIANAHFSLAYAELAAPCLGLGTCWAGLLQGCAFSGYPPLLKILDLPEGKMLAGALMLGYPQYRYYRLVDRNKLDVAWR